MSVIVRLAGTRDFGLYFSQSQSYRSSGTMTRDSSGSIVAKGKLAGFPREHLVMAWKSVDFPELM